MAEQEDFPQWVHQNYNYLQKNYQREQLRSQQKRSTIKDIKKKPQDWQKWQRHGRVKTHTPEQATYEWEDSDNCRGYSQ